MEIIKRAHPVLLLTLRNATSLREAFSFLQGFTITEAVVALYHHRHRHWLDDYLDGPIEPGSQH